MLGKSSVDVPDLLGTVHPFLKPQATVLHSFLTELRQLLKERKARRILSYMSLNVVVTFVLLLWCNSTNSMSLTAYTYLTIFDLFSYERFEVVSVFASTLLAQFGALFIVKESVERMLMQPDIHTGRFLLGTVVAFTLHVFITYSIDNRAFNDVVSASSSSWLQEHVTDISEGLCHFVPGLARLLLPRINPFALIAWAGAAALCVTYLLVDIYNYFLIDTWAAVWIALMTCGTMFPMSVYTGKILLQTTPSHMIGQLDKCLREASTLDGVLEFRHEHFWTVAFGTLAGSVHVRVRRDADEQLVLAHVFNRLSNLVPILTVQIFKDDWTRPTLFSTLDRTSKLASNPPLSRQLLDTSSPAASTAATLVTTSYSQLPIAVSANNPSSSAGMTMATTQMASIPGMVQGSHGSMIGGGMVPKGDQQLPAGVSYFTGHSSGGSPLPLAPVYSGYGGLAGPPTTVGLLQSRVFMGGVSQHSKVSEFSDVELTDRTLLHEDVDVEKNK